VTTSHVLRRWEDFQAVMEEREPKMLRAFTAMEVDASGRLKTEQIQRARCHLPKRTIAGHCDHVSMASWRNP
jgi:hypothetical protein